MGDISSDVTIKDAVPNLGAKVLKVVAPNTTDTADTIDITLSSYGINASDLGGVLGFVHTTENSVLVQEQPTTSVSSGVLTITVGGSTVSNKKRVYYVYA